MKIKTSILNKHFLICIIVFFEFFGTALFAYVNLNLINAKASTTSETIKVFLGLVDFSLSMFMCISFGRQFSGGLFNPSVALFRLFRKTERYPVHVGILYIVIQLLGGICGSFLGK